MDRSFYIEENLKNSHTEICPREIYKSKADIGLRDIILRVISLLKQNKKVVVNDENAKKSTWNSYIQMVKKKVPGKTVVLVSVYPKHGLQQLFWSRQYSLLEDDAWEPVSDSHLTKWFDGSTDVSYHIVDDPSKVKGAETIIQKYPLALRTDVQPDIPGLFLQWEAVFCEDAIKAGVVKTCQLWSKKSQHGRIFVLLDHTKHHVGKDTEFQNQIISCMKALISKLDIPVYLYSVNKDSVKFSIPPNPGLMAVIQKSHGIDLQGQRTVLLYQDQSFTKLAESSGVQSVNAAKVFQKPSLILNRMIFTSPRPPTFLQDIEIRLNDSSSPPPLYDKIGGFHDNCIHDKICQGIESYLFGSGKDSLLRYQDNFKEYLKKKNENITELQNMDTEEISSDEEVKIQNKSITRELPKWMLGTSKSSVSSSRSDSVNSTASTIEVKAKSTVYVMSEQELVDVATEILKQAGREDLLKRIQDRKSTNTCDPSHIDNTIEPTSISATDVTESHTDLDKSCISASTRKRYANGVSESLQSETDPSCISASTRKRKTCRNKSHDSTTSRDILDLDFMDSEECKDGTNQANKDNIDNKKDSSCETKQIEPMEVVKSTCTPIKIDRLKIQIQEKTSHNAQDNSCISDPESEVLLPVKNVGSYVFNKKSEIRTRRESRQPKLHQESFLSSVEPSLNINPAELFQNLPESVSENQSNNRKKEKAASNSKHPDKDKSPHKKYDPKKPDLSFLDDIFG